MIRIAGAPVSFGVFELEPAEGAVVPSAPEVLDVLQSAGYDGIDLGPIGFLGRGEALRAALSDHGLLLAGGWFDLPFHDDEAFAAALPAYREALAVFVEAAELDPANPPLPTLANSGTPERENTPGGGPELELTEAQWVSLARNLETVAQLTRAQGLEPTFHHHACTPVETVAEIEKFLDRTSVGLTFDTGHLILGGGDPVADLLRWRDRVNHIHLKDARLDRLRAVVAAHGTMRDVWTGGAFAALGDGDLDLGAFLAAVDEIGYEGWIVVEQDVIASPAHGLAEMTRDQIKNREALREWQP